MNKKTQIIATLACSLLVFTTSTHAAVPTKAITETIEIVFKKAQAAPPAIASKIAAEKALQEAVKRSVDDVIKFVESGGLKALECGRKYGDNFWNLCRKYPNANAQIANNADTLVPLSKQVGDEVIDIELKAPGLTTELVSIYGNTEVKTLARMGSDDLAKAYAFGKRYPKDAPALLKEVKANPNFLGKLSGTQLLGLGSGIGALATGIGAGSAASQVGDGIQKGLTAVAKESPAIFSVTTIGIIIGSLMTLWLFFCGGIKKIFKFMKVMINKYKTKEVNRPTRHANMKGDNQ